MGNVAGGIEQADGREAKHSVGSGTGLSDPTPTLQKKQPAPPKLPVPPEDELEERFSVVLSYMNLPPDKLKLLSQYDNDKKWELICDQERFQVKNPPSAYLTKIKSFYQDQGGVTRRFKRRVQESTQVLRELEISLRTNHIGWAQEFLNEENQGLDVLVDYLSYAQCDASFDLEGAENGGTLSERGKPAERSMEDLNKSAGSSPTHGMTRAARALTVRITSLAQSRRTQKISRLASQRDDVHVCIMCLRAIMNYQSGFNQVMTHPRCVNEITLSLNNKNPRTKALVLELLAAVCLVRDGHDIILAAFDNLKEVSGEKNRFEKLMEYFSNDDSNIDFMVACMQFINIVVHSVENMNFRVHLQYEFTHHGLDQYLESLKLTESEKLQVQIQAYLDNVFDVGALLEDAENRGGVLEHVDELREHNSQLSARLEEIESQSAERMAELEKQLLQATKETELLKESLRDSCSQVSSLQQREREREMSQERERDRERLSQPSSELEFKVQELQDRGLIRLGRTPSGALDLQVVPVTIIEYAPAPASEPLLSSTGPTAPGLDVPDVTPSSAISSVPLLLPSTSWAWWTCSPTPSTTSSSSSPKWLWWPTSPSSSPSSQWRQPSRSETEKPMAYDLHCSSTQFRGKSRKPIQTKFRMPLLNWQALKPNQVTGTVFHELDDEQVLGELNMEVFEEQFKTKAQGPPAALSTLKVKVAQKAPSKVNLIEGNKAKNLAITLRKGGRSPADICTAIETYDQQALGLDFLELLERFVPSDYEMKLLQNYEKEGRPLDDLAEEDRFMMRFGKIPRLAQRISTLTFMGNFPESVKHLQPQLNSMITASMSIKSSAKLKKMLEIILAFGNYMNSSKRGAAYGFRLQSLDLLLDTKSTDRSQTLLHFISSIVQEKYPELNNFHTELHFVDKAGLVSLDSILQDIRSLERGMEVTKKEFLVQEDNTVLKDFVKTNSELLDSLLKDSKTAQEAYGSVVEYFGENPKTTQPSMFFPPFVRFMKAYKQAEKDNEQKKRLEAQSSENQAESPSPRKKEAAGHKSPMMPKMDLIAELKKRQVKPQVKDGALEDIITDLRNSPFRATDGRRPAQRQDT
ncbi:formin-like protein 1 [Oncorhynchus tshawytscha]|uniref:formin-like protein 1 n=1 Tax=Oncorhynchus tshawytscha TaxID=74940 RepID=UPI001C3E5EB1|nr:formin-like protein 1 [Oncorhynchus tshawytscha]